MQKTQKHDFVNIPIFWLNDYCLLYIFRLLPIADRINAEMVCEGWRILSRESWRTMKILDRSCLTWGLPQYQITTDLAQKAIRRCGDYLKEIHIPCICDSFGGTRLLNVIAEYCPNLTVIDVSGVLICGEDLKLIIENKKITKLTIGSSEAQLEYKLGFLEECLELNHFEVVRNNFFSGKCLLYLPVQAMRTLIINKCPKIDDDEFSTGLARLQNLEHLTIWKNTKIAELTMEVITYKCGNLKHLQIYGHNYSLMLQFFNLVNLQVLKLKQFSWSYELFINITIHSLQITTLDISNGSNVNDSAIEAVAQLPKLEYLCINDLREITDHGLEKLKNLKRLECSGCYKITDVGIKRVLASSPQLQLLDISCCPKITNRTYEAVTKFCDSRSKILQIAFWRTGIILTDICTISPFLDIIPDII